MSRVMSRQPKRKASELCDSIRSTTATTVKNTSRSTPRTRCSTRLSCKQDSKGTSAITRDGYGSDSPRFFQGSANKVEVPSSSSSYFPTSSSSSSCSSPAKTNALKAKRKKTLTQAQLKRQEMTEKEKREDRAKRNRASALKSRNKRRQRLAFLEVECKRLHERIRQLEDQNSGLYQENSKLRKRVEQEEKLKAQAQAQAAEATATATTAAAAAAIASATAKKPVNLHLAQPGMLSASDLEVATPGTPIRDFLDFDTAMDFATTDIASTLGALSSEWSPEDDAILDADLVQPDEQTLPKLSGMRFESNNKLGGFGHAFDRISTAAI